MEILMKIKRNRKVNVESKELNEFFYLLNTYYLTNIKFLQLHNFKILQSFIDSSKLEYENAKGITLERIVLEEVVPL